MTLFYPDISDYDAGISLNGMAAVIVKATEGTTYTSPDYARVAADARSRGIPWAAYHFLHHNSDPAAQARHYHDVAGAVPCMLDVETALDGTKATVGDALTFANQLRALGGHVRLVYLPHWYWQELGSPDLRPLAAAGMGLVSSDYTTYSDTGPGWAAYGGVAPIVWQYTEAHQLNGFSVDFNAFRGTVDQFRALLGGSVPEAGGLTMAGTLMIAHEKGSTTDWIGDGTVRWRSPNPFTTSMAQWAISKQGGDVNSAEFAPGTLVALGPRVITVDVNGNEVPAPDEEAPVLAALAGLTASVQALVTTGTSVDTSAVLTAVGALRAEVDAIKAALAGVLAASASAEQAGATALAQS